MSELNGAPSPIRSKPALQKDETEWKIPYQTPLKNPKSGIKATDKAIAPAASIISVIARTNLTKRITPPICGKESESRIAARSCKPTICTGLAASMGAVLLTAGAKGKRSALPHSRVMIHQPLGGVEGQASDIEITARQILRTKQELYEILALHSDVTIKKIEKDADRDYWMTAPEAQKYGLIDEVLSARKK